MIWKFKGQGFSLTAPRIMGIVNITPDSFSDGGQYLDVNQAVYFARQLIDAGADILDLGAESTRPGAEPVGAKEEIDRILPVLKKLRPQTAIPISIDTTKPAVAVFCLEAGADIINDTSGLQNSPNLMAEAVKNHDAGIILMHRRGTPQTMQSKIEYSDVVADVIEELNASVRRALELGIDQDRIAVDPGIGFAKTGDQCVELLRRIDNFFMLGYPVVLGASRKSFLGKITGSDVGEREFGTAAVSAYAAMKGPCILRVHNVKAAKDVIKVIETINRVEHVGT